jgi:tetratricopeptide (TPR) repeat protein
VHHALGAYQQALDSMQESLRMFQNQSDAKRAAMVLGNMGKVYRALGDKEQAYTCYRQAADVFEELGEKQMYADTLMAMGDLQVRDGKLMQGASTYEVGLEQIDNLTPSQRVLKGLIGIRNRLTGGGSS